MAWSLSSIFKDAVGRFLTWPVMKTLPTQPHLEDRKTDTKQSAPLSEPLPTSPASALDPRHAQQLNEFLARQRRAMGVT